MDKLAQIESDKQFYKNQEQWVKEDVNCSIILGRSYRIVKESVQRKRRSDQDEKYY